MLQAQVASLSCSEPLAGVAQVASLGPAALAARAPERLIAIAPVSLVQVMDMTALALRQRALPAVARNLPPLPRDLLPDGWGRGKATLLPSVGLEQVMDAFDASDFAFPAEAATRLVLWYKGRERVVGWNGGWAGIIAPAYIPAPQPEPAAPVMPFLPFPGQNVSWGAPGPIYTQLLPPTPVAVKPWAPQQVRVVPAPVPIPGSGGFLLAGVLCMAALLLGRRAIRRSAAGYYDT